jgi:hypothetical protein
MTSKWQVALEPKQIAGGGYQDTCEESALIIAGELVLFHKYPSGDLSLGFQ